MKAKSFTFSKYFSYLMLFTGVIFVTVGVASIFDTQNPNAESATLGGFMIGLPTLIGGSLIWWSSFKKSKNELEQFYEEIIYTEAKKNAGIVNAIEVAMALNVPKNKAEGLLNDMVIKGTAITQVNDNGYVEYAFPVFLKEIL